MRGASRLSPNRIECEAVSQALHQRLCRAARLSRRRLLQRRPPPMNTNAIEDCCPVTNPNVILDDDASFRKSLTLFITKKHDLKRIGRETIDRMLVARNECNTVSNRTERTYDNLWILIRGKDGDRPVRPSTNRDIVCANKIPSQSCTVIGIVPSPRIALICEG